MKLFFTINTNPFGKQRPRHNRFTGTTYTPTETKEREAEIAWAYKSQCRGARFKSDEYIKLVVVAFFEIPKSFTAKDRQLIADGKKHPTVKPDWDNIGKLVADALNGIAYDDDKSIVDARVIKVYADKPRIDVYLQSVEEKS